MNYSKTWRPWEFQPPPTSEPKDRSLHDSQALPFCSSPGPENQDVGIRGQLAPSFGLIRTLKRSHTTAAKTPKSLYQESSRMILRDHSTGIHLGMAPMDAYYDPESRGVSRPPTRNPSRTGSRHNWMDPRNWRRRTDKANLSVDRIPVGDLQISTRHDRLNAPLSSTSVVSATSTATSLVTWMADVESGMEKNRQEEPIDEVAHQVDTISLGSDSH